MAPLEFDVDCNWDEFVKLVTFLDCIKEYPLGSLKSYDPPLKPSLLDWWKAIFPVCTKDPVGSVRKVYRLHNMVHARTFWESIMCYVKNEYPPLYLLELPNVWLEY